MFLAGTLREYPFSLLLEIFLHRRETGLLEISSSDESGYFYIKNGKVKEGRIGKNKGPAALKVAGGFKDGYFRFRPLEPADYARVVWQRSFGPTTGLAINESGRSGPTTPNKLIAHAATAFAFWKQRLKLSYPHGYSFHLPSLTINRAAIAGALQQGVDHNVIFALTVTLLLAVGGLCVYQLVYGDHHSIDEAISIDQHFDTAAQAPSTKPKTKQSTNKRRSTRRSRAKSPDRERGARSTQDSPSANSIGVPN
jgi:Domain of unknown function (DUF4388)